MLRHRAYNKLLHALTLTFLTLLAGSAFGQSPSTRPESQQKDVATAEPAPVTPESKVAAAEPRRSDLESEVTSLKAENAAVRELLRKMEEQQKVLMEQMDRLQRRLDGPPIAAVQSVGQTP